MFISNKKLNKLSDGIVELIKKYTAILAKLEEAEKKVQEHDEIIALLSHMKDEPHETKNKFLDRLVDNDGNFNYQNYKRKYGKIVRKDEDE